MKYLKVGIIGILVTLAVLLTVSKEIRGEFGLLSTEERQKITIENGDIGKKVDYEGIDIRDARTNEPFELSLLDNKKHNIVLAGAECPGCRLLIKSYAEESKSISAPLYVLYFNQLPAKLEDNKNIKYLVASGNRYTTYFDSPYTPTIYMVGQNGIVTDKLIGFADNYVSALVR